MSNNYFNYQRISTKEPEDGMIEIAIAALKACEPKTPDVDRAIDKIIAEQKAEEETTEDETTEELIEVEEIRVTRAVFIDDSIEYHVHELDNGDFEDGIDGWGTKYKSVISEDYTNAHSGDGSIKIALSDGLAATQYNIKEVLSKNGTGTYLLEFWAKADINDAPLVIYCPKYDNAAGVNVYTSVKLNKEWTKYTVEKNLTWTDLGNPILIFGHDNQANKGFTFWLDDVVYTKK